MYALIKNDVVVTYPYGINNLRQDNPNTSFPASMPDESLAEWDVYPVQSAPGPNADHTKTVTKGMPELVDGKWTQTWIVADATAEEIAIRIEEMAQSIRTQRNQMLSDSDWTQVDDTPLTNTAKQEWAIYRQALRDITKQDGFPASITWPVQP